jgi:hypothetical protein
MTHIRCGFAVRSAMADTISVPNRPNMSVETNGWTNETSIGAGIVTAIGPVMAVPMKKTTTFPTAANRAAIAAARITARMDPSKK